MVEVASPEVGLNVETLSHGPLAWVYVEHPTSAESDYLTGLGLHPVHVAEALGRGQQPKLVAASDYLYLVLGVPTTGSARVAPSGASIFLGPERLVTLHHGNVRPLARLFRECQADPDRRSESLGRGPGHLLYLIAERVVASCQQSTAALAARVRDAEEAALAGEDADLVAEIALLRREVDVLARLAEAQRQTLGQLTASDLQSRLGEELAPHWRSLADRAGQTEASVAACREALLSLQATQDALLARRSERAARLTAVVATLTLPPILLAVLFGVNVRDLPLADDPYAFEVLLAVALLFAVGALYAFRRRGWL